MERKLIDYIIKQRRNKVSDEYIQKALLNKGWDHNEISEAFYHIPAIKKKRRDKALKFFFLLLLIFLITMSIYAYFFIISPIDVEKPILEKDTNQLFQESMTEEDIILETKHIAYFSNEIGAYKLHNDIRNGNIPIIAFIVDGTSYRVIVKDNFPKASEGDADDADLVVKTSKEDIFEVLDSNDISEKLVEKVENGDIIIEMKADEVTLGLKGYKAIYDTIMKDSNILTGNFMKKIIKIK